MSEPFDSYVLELAERAITMATEKGLPPGGVIAGFLCAAATVCMAEERTAPTDRVKLLENAGLAYDKALEAHRRVAAMAKGGSA